MTAVVMPDQLPRTANVEIDYELLCARYSWLRAFFGLNGFLPSNEVIGEGWGGLSRAAVPRSLSKMQAQGWLRLVGEGQKKAIVLEESDGCAKQPDAND
jgi:hypothetical protein